MADFKDIKIFYNNVTDCYVIHSRALWALQIFINKCPNPYFWFYKSHQFS